MNAPTHPSSVDVLRDPERFFSKPLTFTDALVPLGLAAVVGVWLAHAHQPYIAQAVMQSLPADAAQRFAADPDSPFRMSWMADAGAVFRPIVTSGLYAVMAFLLLSAIDYRPRFEALHVCAAWSMLAITGKSVVQFLVLASGGLSGVRDPSDLSPGTGLGFLAASNQSLLYDGLELVNGFDLALVFAFAAAIRIAVPTTTRHAVAAAALPWLLVSAIRIGFNVVLYR